MLASSLAISFYFIYLFIHLWNSWLCFVHFYWSTPFPAPENCSQSPSPTENRKQSGKINIRAWKVLSAYCWDDSTLFCPCSRETNTELVDYLFLMHYFTYDPRMILWCIVMHITTFSIDLTKIIAWLALKWNNNNKKKNRKVHKLDSYYGYFSKVFSLYPPPPYSYFVMSFIYFTIHLN